MTGLALVTGAGWTALRPAAPGPDGGLPGTRHIVVVPQDQVPPDAVVLGVLVELPGPLRDPSPPVAESAPAPLVPQVPVPPPVRPGLVVDADARRVIADGAELDLTRREFDLLEHFVDRPGRVLTRSQLIRAVWQFDDPRYTGARTVDVHVSRLRRKLGRHGESLHTLRGVGYRWLP